MTVGKARNNAVSRKSSISSSILSNETLQARKQCKRLEWAIRGQKVYYVHIKDIHIFCIRGFEFDTRFELSKSTQIVVHVLK